MAKYIIIYDQNGTILSQYGAEQITPPVGVPYILLDHYQSPANGSMVIERVDVSMDPHRLVFGNPTMEEEISKIPLEEYKRRKQDSNKQSLEHFLSTHPLLWADGRYYGVSKEDQNNMIMVKAAYDLKQSMGACWPLQWCSVDGVCKDFEENEFVCLMNEIVNFVYPYRQLEMYYKDKIYKASTKEEVDAVNIVYMMPIDLDLMRS